MVAQIARQRRLLVALVLALVGCSGARGDVHAPAATAKPADPTASSPAASDDAPRSEANAPAAVGTWPLGPAPAEGENEAQLERLLADRGPMRTNWTPPGHEERYGHAEALIAAPYDVVRARLVDFAHYDDLAGPRFKKVTVVDKRRGATDVYFQLPIMKGAMTIWYVARFSEPRPREGDGAEVVEGTFVRGNIKTMQLVFTTRRGRDAQSAVLTCDLLLALKFPAPQGPIDEALRNACGDAVAAVRARTEDPNATSAGHLKAR